MLHRPIRYLWCTLTLLCDVIFECFSRKWVVLNKWREWIFSVNISFLWKRKKLFKRWEYQFNEDNSLVSYTETGQLVHLLIHNKIFVDSKWSSLIISLRYNPRIKSKPCLGKGKVALFFVFFLPYQILSMRTSESVYINHFWYSGVICLWGLIHSKGHLNEKRSTLRKLEPSVIL